MIMLIMLEFDLDASQLIRTFIYPVYVMAWIQSYRPSIETKDAAT